MSSFLIRGGRSLSGEITPQGAKNEALQVVSAVLLTAEEVTIENLPDIVDVNKLIGLLQEMGVEATNLSPGTWRFSARNIDLDYMHTEEYRQKASALRGSVMLLGPLAGRFGTGFLPQPGGDKIGRRRLDTHFMGLQKLGVQFRYDDDARAYHIHADKLKGCYILLEEASVTGTANVVMAAVLAEGETTLFNAACEPYVVQLCRMLNRMGAQIEGIGSNLLHINGVNTLHGTSHRLLADMIEVGSFIGLAAMTQSDILIKDTNYDHLGCIPDTFRKLGIDLIREGDNIRVPATDYYEIENFIDGSILTIADAPWPGFTPDLLSIVLVVATQARGSVLVHQKMFESRLFFVDKLIDMGAKIILCDPHRATIIGLDRKTQLKGIRMSSPDIRAGVSLLIAALSASGTSIIDNINQIDRGYQHIDLRLQALGADITRTDT
jgi:UDP-N-acetylglucosamine 1-carboxyvinyltransferase